MVLLPSNYPQLQNLIKRDSKSYVTEFEQQYQHFKASLSILELTPSAANDLFEPLLAFISHVAYCYPQAKEEFPTLIYSILDQQANCLHPSIRKAMVQALLQIRKHNLIDLLKLLQLFFHLLRIADKSLRDLLTQSIVGEIRRANHPHRNNSLNSRLQNFMYGLLEEAARAELKSGSEEGSAVNRILFVIIELYRKGIWNDANTVNVLADAAMKKISHKVLVTSLNFFIGRFKGKSLENGLKDGSDDDSDGDADENYKDLLQRSTFNGMGKKRSTSKKLKKALNAVHRKEKKQGKGDEASGNFSAIQLLNDPQGFAERLFSHLRQSKDPFETKLLLMNVISRVIGSHKVILLDFYSFLLRYITPNQKEVTHILAYVAQASHSLVPSDVIDPLVVAIAHNFAAEHCTNEVIAVGLNGLREICSRCPSAMNADLLQDLSQFKGYHDKGVIMAARSLIGLYREINPEMLHRRDRGKEVSLKLQQKKQKLQEKQEELEEVEEVEEEEEFEEEELEEDFDGSEEENIEFDEEDSQSVDDEELSESETEVSKVAPVSVKDKKKSILQKAASSILETPADFARFRKRMAGELSDTDEDNNGSSSEEEGNNDIVNPNMLASKKKQKQDYESRMASIKAGRDDRLKYGSRKGKHHDRASTSNKVKEKKTKNAIMLVHKSAVRAKKRRSQKEKQQAMVKQRKNKRRH